VTDEQSEVAARLESATRRIEACPEFRLLVPEVRVNFVYSIADPRTPDDMAAVDGRITVVAGLPRAAGPVRFGASDHMARLVIECRRHDRSVRAGLNFRWSETILEFLATWCREKNLTLGTIDRTEEPRDLIGKDRASMPWKVRRLVQTSGRVPPVFYESRGWGKEPLFFMVGPEPTKLAEQVVDIARRFASHA
jgi:hydroxymethylpyrimidine/phosphomethylpyrimidine kinase